MTQALARSGANESLPATITRIERAIEAAATPEQIRKVIALADAAVAFANTYFKEQREMIQRAKSVKLQAERKLGEILAAMPKNEGAKGTGANQYGGAVPKENRTSPPTLADLGIDKKVSARARKLAALPAEQFAAVVAGEVPVSRVVASKPALSRRAPQRTKAAEARREAVSQAQANHVSMLVTYARMTIKELQSERDLSDEEIRLVAELADLCARVVRRAQALPA